MEKVTLYDIDERYKLLLAQAKDEAERNEGIIPDTLSDQLDALEMTRDIKIENSIKYYKNESAVADMIAAEIDSLQQRQRQHKRTAEWMKYYLAQFVKVNEKPEYSCGKISWRKSKAVLISDSALVPDMFCKIERIPQKDSIKKELENGRIVSGATIEERNNLQIR